MLSAICLEKSVFSLESSAFVVESTNLTEIHDKNKDKGAYLRFKRVSNFTLLDSQTAFIIEKIDQDFSQSDILFELQQNYDIDEEKAKDILQSTLRDLEATRGANKKRSIMIKKNPGFKTVMSLDSVASEISSCICWFGLPCELLGLFIFFP
jgi:hypothetical protein